MLLSTDVRTGKTIYKTHFYNLRTYFKQIKEWDRNVFPEKVNECEFLADMLQDYEERLNQLYKQNKEQIIKAIKNEYNEFYEKYISLRENDNGFFLVWDIQKIRELIKERKLEPVTVPMEYLRISIETSIINPSKLKRTSDKKDLPIVGIYPFFEGDEQFFVLDGNHRIYKRFKEGYSDIKCYVISYDILKKGVISELYKELMDVYGNLQIIINYCLGNVPIQELKLLQLQGLFCPIINETY